MKKITLSFLTLLSAGFSLPAAASELMIAATMQRCATNEECMLVTNSCKDNCGFVPVNKSNMSILQSQYQTRCGKAMEAAPACNMNPPISAACVNERCTIDYAYQNNASAGDYQSGAYAVPEAAVQSKVKGDYSKINDRQGFTAYDLPQDEVRANTVGTINSTVYVPPSAPVSGNAYVPLASDTAVPPPTPMAAPMTAAPAMPTPAVPATPELVPPVATGNNNVPNMTPSLPNMPPPGTAEATATPYQYIAPETVVTAPQPSAPMPVPVAPPGSQPIPPSDLQPAPTFLPPAGGTIPANPEDPGAPPPAGMKVILKGSQMETVSTKAFGTKMMGEKKAAKVGSYN